MSKTSDVVKKILALRESPMDLAKITTEWLSLVGGAKGVAERLENEYKHSKPGGLARSRILELILKLTEKSFADRRVADMSLLATKDLEKLVIHYLAKVNDGETGKNEGEADDTSDTNDTSD